MSDDFDTLSDEEIVAKTAWGEARGEGTEGMHAVISTIQNRLSSGVSWWGTTLRTICLHSYQFSCWNDNDSNLPKMLAVTTSDPQYAGAINLAGMALVGILPDITCGADSYLVTGTKAGWARNLTPVAVIGRHSFYRTV